MNRSATSFELLAMLLLVGVALALSPVAPEDWERRGNDAFVAGRFDEAAACYERSAQASREPARIAHNHAVSLSQLGQYRDAERLFRNCLDSPAEPASRARACYDLGTCLLFAAEGRDLRRVTEAMEHLSHCVNHLGADDALRTDATFNLELARRLWRKLSDASAPPPPDKDPGSDNNPDSKPAENPMGGNPMDPNGTGPKNGSVTPMPTPMGADTPKPMPTNDRPPPGAGTQPPLPDDEQLKPMPPAESRELLRQAMERIARERRALQRAGAGPDQRAYPDW